MFVVVARRDGTVTAFEDDSLESRWTTATSGRIHELAVCGDVAVVATGCEGTATVAAYALEDGRRRWQYDVSPPDGDDVGASRVVALEDGATDRLYAAVRRVGDGRRSGTVLAFDRDGRVRWRYGTDASPVALAATERGDRLAVGYDRCPGAHDNGLVVLETDAGELAWTWDPGTAGDRRVSDVAFDGDTVAVASCGDGCGYLLTDGGAERWRVPFGTEDGARAPTHAYAHDGRAVFAVEPIEHRDTDHRIVAVDGDGGALWTASGRGRIDGFATNGDVLVPRPVGADVDTHAVRRFVLETGSAEDVRLDGTVTAATVGEGTIAVIERRRSFSDGETTRAEDTLLVGAVMQQD
ncbi:hypothetical protein Natoc_1098 [Natronococcus occultus SP4]|uniref:Pyrrolo-quinoline quinone repeat domain-containing protein n=1 Tax=Natronococcus occultus SP4 TaxID=694430 RepID=L0JVZ8_9EURY|nr:hypothetical protein Natoc_1098 [Natronococcus occultus SP4]